MTYTDMSKQALSLAAIGPLFACSTSVITALIVVAVLLVCTLCTSTAVKVVARPQRDTRARGHTGLVIATFISAIIVAIVLLSLITLGLSDIVAAFAPQMTLAAFAATLLGYSEEPLQTTAKSGALIIATGVVCELIGHGTLLGDYELAFAGTIHGWLLRTGLPPIASLATPAGALLVAAVIVGITSLLHSRKAIRDDATPITEPRSGRRVRVTGHIS